MPDHLKKRRDRMVDEQIVARGISDPAILRAFSRVERDQFVPKGWRDRAYGDGPLPIGHEQTISQPYVIALMLFHLALQAEHKVLEVGTGSGYVAALLAEICEHVYSIECVEELAQVASDRLVRLGYPQVKVRHGDGSLGWPEGGSFDRIIVSAAARDIPRELIKQLKIGGRMILPFGDESSQKLVLLNKDVDGITEEDLGKVSFVPLIQS